MAQDDSSCRPVVAGRLYRDDSDGELVMALSSQPDALREGAYFRYACVIVSKSNFPDMPSLGEHAFRDLERMSWRELA